MNRFMFWPVAILLLAAVLSGCDSASSPVSLTPAVITLSLRTPIASVAVDTYLPIVLGYWRDEGLEVTVQGFDGTSDALQPVLLGNALASTAAGTSAIAAADAAGSDLKCFVAGITDRLLYLLRMPESKDINGFADLKGKKIGVSNISSAHVSWTAAALRDAGVDPKSVTMLPVGTGLEGAKALADGRVDVYVVVDNGAAVAQERFGAVQVDAPYFAKLGFNTCMAARTGDIEAKRSNFVGLCRGYLKALVFANANPVAAVKLFWRAYPTSRPIADPEKGLDRALSELKSRIATMNPAEGKYGFVPNEVVDFQLESLLSGGAISKPVTRDQVWTSSLIKDCNSFDVGAVEKQAREWVE
jgi:NitT/TauT family transport system substrate-binding protein